MGSRNDSGTYTCTAQNLFGSQSLPINVTTLEAPDPPFDLRKTVVESRKAELHWSVLFDGNSAITAYAIEMNGQTCKKEVTYLFINAIVLIKSGYLFENLQLLVIIAYLLLVTSVNFVLLTFAWIVLYCYTITVKLTYNFLQV